jgi:phosphate/sulfate permease
VAGRIVWAWVLTVPGAAAIASMTELALMGLGLDPR